MNMTNDADTIIKLLTDTIAKFNVNAVLTQDSENHEPILIVEDWHDVAILNRELKFQSMRLSTNGHAPYTIPDGLFELDDIINLGFSDEWITCYNCGKAVYTTPGDYGDSPRYAILDGDFLCGDCIFENWENEYIEQCTNNPNNALKTTIIPEYRLEDMGWKRLKRKYESGLHERMNDNPVDVYNKLKDKWDVLFTLQNHQFYIEFWAWVRKPSSDDEGL